MSQPTPHTHAPTRSVVCPCGVEFESAAGKKYCSKRCGNLVRETRRKFPCAGCAKPMWVCGTGLPSGEGFCRDCRRFVADSRHDAAGYKRGCRCQVCRAAVAADAREYRAMVRGRDGVSLSSKRKTTTRFYWIAPPKRLAIYERDGWVCQLCAEPVDPTLHPNHRFAATLDHIECQSWALIPDHSPENLRLAHRACNSSRRDREDGPARVA